MRASNFIAGTLAPALLAAIAILGAPPSAIADSAETSPARRDQSCRSDGDGMRRVASAKYATNANRQPTFLNLDKPYPNHLFTAVIWGSDRAAFPYAPESLANRRICVTGTIQLYRGKAEIVVSGPNQIRTSE